VGRVVQPFVIPPRRATGTITRNLTTAGTATLASLSGGESYEFRKEVVLDSKVVGKFLGRLKEQTGAAMSPALNAALDQASSGRLDALTTPPPSGSDDELAAAFLEGLRLLHAGDLENAAGQFRAALALESDFFPALFYLGACYAAGGRDQEASAAWQTSLISETDSVVYDVLSESLLRLNDTEQAIAVLREAIEIFPDDAGFTRRLAHLYASTGQSAEALQTIAPLLDAEPADEEALFLAMRLLYEALASGRPIGDDDQGLLTRYAERYRSADGARRDLVSQWVAALKDKRP
jgi:tetratricopeptide (TPR) repeat protein